ncbi:MAG: DSD1 family PLP-dependent enzyme [Blastocatellia bacterium]
MDTSRRNFLQNSAGLALMTGAPHLWIRKPMTGYTHHEIDERVKNGKGLKGLTKADLITPCLLLDLDAFEANVKKLAAHTQAAGIGLRPHGKSHKCVEIAQRQKQAGAMGLCVATVREADAMSAAGVRGLLLTSEPVGAARIRRLLDVVRRAPDTIAVVDHAVNAQDLSDAAQAAKLKLNVLVDVDPGMRRTGAPAGDASVALAEKIMKLPGLKLRGMQCYSGVTAHVTGFENRRNHSIQMMTPALETFARLQKMGMPMEILSGGSTGTYNIDPQLKGMTELQCGSYVFMDVEYQRIGGQSGEVYTDFAVSLTVMGTVISRNYPDRMTVDSGIKSFATDRKFFADLKDVTGAKIAGVSDEHGIIMLENPSRDFKPGDRVEFIVPHCDPNVNLYDRMYCVRGEHVVDVWKIVGRHGD